MSINRIQTSAGNFPISEVTLYSSNRAEVKRTVEVNTLHSGENEIRVEQLPSGLLDDTIRVEGRSSLSTTLKSVTHEIVASPTRTIIPTSSSDHLKGLEKRLKTQRATLTRERLASDTVMNYLSKLDPKDASVGQLKESLAFFGDRARSSDAEEEQLKASIEDIEEGVTEEKARLEKECQAAQAKADLEREEATKLRSCITVVVWVDPGQDSKDLAIALNIEYTVNNAAWSPLYEARVRSRVDDDNAKPLHLSYKATIAQQTGEDWKDVKLILSTATPALGSTKPPRLPQWTVSVVTTGRGKGLGTGGAMRHRKILTEAESEDDDMGFALFDSGEGPVRPSAVNIASIVGASSDASQTSSSFEIPGKTTVVSYGRSHSCDEAQNSHPEKKTVTIADLNLSADLQWIAIPRIVEQVFLEARVTNTSQFQLLEGASNVFLDSSFIAASRMPSVSPQEAFTINLGTDSTVKVAYHSLSKRVGTSGFGFVGSRSDVRHFTQRFTIHNTKTVPLPNLSVLDHIPVSQHEKIQARLLVPALPLSASEDNRKWTRIGDGARVRWAGIEGHAEDEFGRQKGEGKLEWQLEMKPTQKRVFEFQFEVSSPSNTQITGLDL